MPCSIFLEKAEKEKLGGGKQGGVFVIVFVIVFILQPMGEPTDSTDCIDQ
jgi:hypothetical protein